MTEEPLLIGMFVPFIMFTIGIIIMIYGGGNKQVNEWLFKERRWWWDRKKINVKHKT